MTLSVIWAALTGSRPVLYALAILVGVGGYEGWKYHQQGIGASKLEAKIERKADVNITTLAKPARDAAVSGAGNVRNPYVRTD